ncbi:hypothetical protein GCM10011428_55210 [Streptomyces violaceus]
MVAAASWSPTSRSNHSGISRLSYRCHQPGPPQQLEQHRHLVVVGAVQLEQRADIVLRRRAAALARLDAGQLRGTEPDSARRLVLGESGVLTETSQLHTDQHLQQSRRRLGPVQIGFQTGDAMRRGGHPDSQQTGTRATYTIALARASPHRPVEAPQK